MQAPTIAVFCQPSCWRSRGGAGAGEITERIRMHDGSWKKEARCEEKTWNPWQEHRRMVVFATSPLLLSSTLYHETRSSRRNVEIFSVFLVLCGSLTFATATTSGTVTSLPSFDLFLPRYRHSANGLAKDFTSLFLTDLPRSLIVSKVCAPTARGSSSLSRKGTHRMRRPSPSKIVPCPSGII